MSSTGGSFCKPQVGAEIQEGQGHRGPDGLKQAGSAQHEAPGGGGQKTGRISIEGEEKYLFNQRGAHMVEPGKVGQAPEARKSLY